MTVSIKKITKGRVSCLDLGQAVLGKIQTDLFQWQIPRAQESAP